MNAHEDWSRFEPDPSAGYPAPRDASPTIPPPRIVRPTEFQGRPIPERRWLVQEWAPWGVVTGLYGEGGLGKTLLAQQLQTAAAIGESWLGLLTTPMRSLAMYCEDDEEELWRRQADIDRLYGCDFKDLDNAVWMPRLADENLLIRFSGRTGAGELTPLHARLKEAALDHKAELVIVDTVADTFGGNENDRGQVRAYVSWCLGSIARAIGGSVICCAHPSRSGISSGTGDGGSTGWSAAFRSRMWLHMPQAEEGAPVDRDARVLSRKKANYAAREDAIDLRWKAGALVPVLQATGAYKRSCEEVFLALLDVFTATERPLSNVSNASNYAPRMFLRGDGTDGYKKRDFERAMEALFRAGKITMRSYGKPSEGKRRIARVEGA